MADHLVVCDLETGRVLPYLTPLGVRGEGLRTWADALARAEVMETVSEVTGRVVLRAKEKSVGPAVTWGNVGSGAAWRLGRVWPVGLGWELLHQRPRPRTTPADAIFPEGRRVSDRTRR